jgi:DNA-binding winged helix-turn-helix (wHTH) protein
MKMLSPPEHSPNQISEARTGVPPRLRIGEWWVNRTTNEIGRADDTVRLEPKVMEVLMVLADRAAAVVSREELLSGVWPGVVVGDEALTQSIIKLRKALGDNPRSPAYIETIPKRGYRLIAQVAYGDAAPGDEGSASRRSARDSVARSGGGHGAGRDRGRCLFRRGVAAFSAHARGRG